MKMTTSFSYAWAHFCWWWSWWFIWWWWKALNLSWTWFLYKVKPILL